MSAGISASFILFYRFPLNHFPVPLRHRPHNVAEVTSSGQHHYATVRENLIEMCVNAPGGPPANSEELLNRLMLTNGTLFDLYEGYPEQQAYLETLLKRPQDALSTYGHYRAFFSKLHGKLDGDWAYDDCDAAYVL